MNLDCIKNIGMKIVIILDLPEFLNAPLSRLLDDAR